MKTATDIPQNQKLIVEWMELPGSMDILNHAGSSAFHLMSKYTKATRTNDRNRYRALIKKYHEAKSVYSNLLSDLVIKKVQG
jgi:hypothetical protein